MAAERFVHHKVALFGRGIFVFLLLLSTVGAHSSGTTATRRSPGSSATGPSLQHPFGTDTIGHDMFAQVLDGTATSIEIALVVAVIATVIGTLIGAVAATTAGWPTRC